MSAFEVPRSTKQDVEERLVRMRQLVDLPGGTVTCFANNSELWCWTETERIDLLQVYMINNAGKPYGGQGVNWFTDIYTSEGEVPEGSSVWHIRHLPLDARVILRDPTLGNIDRESTLAEVLDLGLRARTPRKNSSLFSQLARLGPITGLWPVDRSLEEPYFSTVESFAGFEPPNGEQHERFFTSCSLADRYPITLFCAASYVELALYAEAYSFTIHLDRWLRVVGQNDLQLIGCSSDHVEFIMHRPPTDMPEAEALISEFDQMALEEYPAPVELLKGGLLRLISCS
jgi:hypothetical protein